MTGNPSASPITKADALFRIQRFASLRAAQRALAPSLRTPVTTDQLEETRSLRLRVQRLIAGAQSAGKRAVQPSEEGSSPSMPPEAELALLDAQLDRLARELAIQLSDVPFSQLRATLSSETGAERTEALALLDLCLESESIPDRFLYLVDYLVTLLSIGMRDGRWAMVSDPADVNEKVRQRCWAAASTAPRFAPELLDRFIDSARRIERGEDVRSTLDEMAALKLENAKHLFVPDLLRCIVRYNVAARNHYSEAMQLGRERDEAMDKQTSIEAEATTLDAVKAKTASPVSDAVSRIQAALRVQMSGGTAPSGERTPISEILEGFSPDSIGASERIAFTSATDDGILDTVRRTVVLGFLQRSFELLEEPLEELGIDLASLTDFAQEFGAELQSEINGLLVENSYDSARQLSEIRTTHLLGLTQGLTPKDRKTRPPLPEKPGHEGTSRRLQRVSARKQAEAPRASDEVFSRPQRSPAVRWAWVVPALAVCLILLTQGAPSAPRTVESLSETRLRVISRLLESGYRDHAEDRPIFVGTLKPKWTELPDGSKLRVAERIRDELQRKGVYEVLLYDTKLNLQAHYIDTPRTPRQRWSVPKAGTRTS